MDSHKQAFFIINDHSRYHYHFTVINLSVYSAVGPLLQHNIQCRSMHHFQSLLAPNPKINTF